MRRYFLDKKLTSLSESVQGSIIDMGGTRIRRGKFQIPDDLKERWKILNSDPKSEPDFLETLPHSNLETNSFDNCFAFEVAEYIFDFQSFIEEMARVTRPGGRVILSTPFLHPLHGDFESDYHRFTESYLKRSLEALSLKEIKIEQMGGFFAVVYDLLRDRFQGKPGINSLFLKMLKALSPLFLFLDSRFLNKRSLTTGFWVSCRK